MVGIYHKYLNFLYKKIVLIHSNHTSTLQIFGYLKVGIVGLERSQRDTLCDRIWECYETDLESRHFNPKKRPARARDIIDMLQNGKYLGILKNWQFLSSILRCNTYHMDPCTRTYWISRGWALVLQEQGQGFHDVSCFTHIYILFRQ